MQHSWWQRWDEHAVSLGHTRWVFTGCSQDRALGWRFCSYNHLFQSLRQACKDITAIGPICRWGNGRFWGSSGLCKGYTGGPVAGLGFWPRPVLLTTLHPVSPLSFDGEFWVMFWLTWGHTLGLIQEHFWSKVWGQLPGVECLFPPDTDFDFLHIVTERLRPWAVSYTGIRWGRKFNLGPEMRLDHSELLCSKVHVHPWLIHVNVW